MEIMIAIFIVTFVGLTIGWCVADLLVTNAGTVDR